MRKGATIHDIPDILQTICRVKRREIAELTAGTRCAFENAVEQQDPPRGFRAALAGQNTVSLIAEVKKASPSAGVIRPDFDPVAVARAYQSAGAACVSVLTDREFFQGSTVFLSRIREEVDLPLLRKDFILDRVQVLEARALGADACLLIVAALEQPALEDLLAHVRDLGMDALVEVHDDAELDRALQAGADLLGVNNRNLHTFEVSLETTERLAERVPEDLVLVGESGIRTRSDIQRLKAAGIDAVLVGESLMRSDDVEAAARELTGV
ncbi:MAG: indole-3-glycerol phosphate synthase TrpC [Planctomycetota bacterium]